MSLTETGTELTGGTSISFVDGSVTSYDNGQTSVRTTAYALDANGLPTEYTKTGTNKDGSQFSSRYTLDVQANGSGLPETVSLAKDNGETEYTMSYTYENGLISGIERVYVPNNNVSSIAFDEDGWEIDEEKSDSIEFSYDENGNITEVIKNGEVITTIQYVKIDSPSPFAYSHSHLKIKLSGLIMYPSASSSLLPLACWLPNGAFTL